MSYSYIPNTAAIPNVLFDYWMQKLSPAEFKVLMCIARKTYGFNKGLDRISISQIEKMTGLSRKGITKNIDILMENGLVNKFKSKTVDGDDAANQYEINLNCITPNDKNCMVGGSELSTLPGSELSTLGVVYSVHPQNTTYKTQQLQNNYTPPIPPQNPEILQPTNEAAKAASVGENESSLKPKREKPDFSPKVRELANQLLNLLSKNCPVYRPPSDLTKFLSHVQDLIEKDKQDPAIVLKTFEWAILDNEKRGDFNGWQGIIATNTKGRNITTPAEVFRKHFSKIYSQMGSRAKRKFAPSSDDNDALEKMKEMSSRAI